jgi:predicted CXXCH cytochrome family protein
MMKSMMKLAVAAALVFAAQTAQAGIAGTSHDMSARGFGTTEICIFCHTPHNANADKLAPLWNHGSSTATYTLYTSGTMNAAGGQPAGTSKACLSCHDGTVARDTYGTRTGTSLITGSTLVGTDLSNDHPVSITYDAAVALADGSLKTPASASLVSVGVPLFGAKVECASCHDVHDNSVVGGNFLRVSNAGSALCIKCHNQ